MEELRQNINDFSKAGWISQPFYLSKDEEKNKKKGKPAREGLPYLTKPLSENAVEKWLDKGVNSFLIYKKNMVVIDYDTEETLKQRDLFPKPFMVVETGPLKDNPDKNGQHHYYEQDGSITNNKRVKGIDLRCGVVNGGVFCPGSYHPIKKDIYKIIETNEDTIKLTKSHVEVMDQLFDKVEETKDFYVDKVEKLIDGMSRGDINARLNEAVFISAKNGNLELAQRALNTALQFNHTGAKATYNSAWKAGERQKIMTTQLEFMKKEDPDIEEKIFDKVNYLTFEKIFAMKGIKFRDNLLRLRIEYKEGDKPWTTISNKLNEKWRCEIKTEFYKRSATGISEISFTLQDYNDCISAVAQKNEVHPVRDWFKRLPPWDKKPRIDHILIDLFKAEDTEYNKAISRLIFLGVTQRVMDPGCQLREIPVLIGEQNVGKTQFSGNLLPPELDAFNGSFSFTDGNKERIDNIKSFSVVEIGEMSGMSKADINGIKNFITREKDVYRPAYKPMDEIFPRQCYFIGTANHDQPIPKDSTGSSRFMAIELKEEYDIKEYLDNNREQLFAEAYERYKNGERARLEAKFRDLQEQTNVSHSGIYDTPIAIKLTELDPKDFLEGADIFKIARSIRILDHDEDDVKLPHKVSLEIGRVLRSLGWEKKRARIDGKLSSVWFPVEVDNE